MTDRLGDAAANVGLAVVATAAGVGSWRLGLGDVHNPGPGFMPFAAAAALGLMALVRLALLTAPREGGRVSAAPFPRPRLGVVAAVLGSLIGFGAVIDTLGFAVSTAVLLFVLFALVAGRRWWVAVAAALAVATAASLLFRALGLQLPRGPLGL
jgi:hypothetical protein